MAVPYATGGGRLLRTSQNLAIVADAALQREALDLLRELALDDSGNAYAAAIGALPPSLGRAREVLRGFPELTRAFISGLDRARMFPTLDSLGTLEKVFDRSMDRLVQAVVAHRFDETVLREEMIHSGAELDYIVSLSGA